METLNVGIKTLAVKVGKHQTLPVEYTGEWGDIKFSTTNAKVCTVDENGVITPLKAGLTVITITAPGIAPKAVTVTVTN